MNASDAQNLTSHFDTWLNNHQNLVSSRQQLQHSTLFAAPRDGDSTVSGQNTIGAGKNAKTESAQGKKLDDAINAGNHSEIVDLLTESTGNAVSSILGLAQSRTGWNPLDPDNDKNAEGFQEFVSSILKVPFFNVTQSERTTVHYEEENYNSLIDKVVGLYDGITEQDVPLIKNSIVNLAKACTSRVNTQNTKTLFVQNTMNATGTDIVVGIQQTFMMMERSHSSGKGAPKDHYKTEITVNVMELTFKGGLWNKSAAEKLADKFVKSWDDWLDGTTTPASPSADQTQFCFGPTHSARQKQEADAIK
ncbi:hypothetical protein [Salinivibrio kushneri]|uniref:hypothetical protein n=1 Tax=Salinivibrio kushneri TaxID=1908198 RepID=UPI000984A6EC|nr:hypothetical protein [Salinivibrio kushneri]OOE48866.1 hypothetical protein BZG11_13490 [Salinivibrio kushneri]OOE60886.1 hypothetical protein BZG18_10520 [Salinivibrio kushneri]